MKKSNYTNKKNWIILSIVVINVLNSYFTYPFFYSNDGAAYLSSARSIFTKDAFIAYEWIREPGYPLFLKYINEFLGRSGNYVILIQSILLVLSIIIVAKIYESYISQNNKLTYWITVGIISLFSQIYFQYSGMILQQSIFAFLLSLFAWYLNLQYKFHQMLIFGTVVIFISVNTSILFYYFNFLFLTILLVKHLYSIKGEKIKLGALIFCILTLFLVNYISIKPWETYKQKILEQNEIIISLDKPKVDGDTTFKDNSGRIVKVKIQAPLVNGNFIREKFSSRAVDSLKGLFFSSKENSENFVFMNTLLQDNFDCGGNIAQGALNFTQYSQFYFFYSCKNGFLRNSVHTVFLNTYFYVYFITIILFLILSIKDFILRKLNISIIFFPYIFVFLYYLLLFDVDRYMIPIYPFALSIVAYNLVALITCIKNKFNEIGKDSNL